MDSRCYTCFEKSFYSLLSKYNFSEVDELKAKKEFLKYLSELDNGVVAPQIARDIHAKFRELLNDEDPYSEEKNDHNKTILTLFRELEKNVLLSENPFNKALRYAIAGNIIDFGPAQKFDLLKTIEKVEKSAFAIDDSQELERAIAKAKNILYLGDNSGEIVLDKLFIKKDFEKLLNGLILDDGSIKVDELSYVPAQKKNNV
ncbi:MAG: ARMT1-like domain-containing protein, partial [Bacteroidota bacterium]|nr:ARMT1-like domain-containing protein [Bacteroidota bacterium]